MMKVAVRFLIIHSKKCKRSDNIIRMVQKDYCNKNSRQTAQSKLDEENQQSCTSSLIREMSPETEKIFNILTKKMLEEPCEDSFVERCSENPLQGIVSIKDSSHCNERQTYVEASDSNDEETVCPFKPKDVINSMSGSECTVVQRIDNTQSRQETYIEASDDEELASCLQRDCTNEVHNDDVSSPTLLSNLSIPPPSYSPLTPHITKSVPNDAHIAFDQIVEEPTSPRLEDNDGVTSPTLLSNLSIPPPSYSPLTPYIMKSVPNDTHIALDQIVEEPTSLRLEDNDNLTYNSDDSVRDPDFIAQDTTDSESDTDCDEVRIKTTQALIHSPSTATEKRKSTERLNVEDVMKEIERETENNTEGSEEAEKQINYRQEIANDIVCSLENAPENENEGRKKRGRKLKEKYSRQEIKEEKYKNLPYQTKKKEILNVHAKKIANLVSKEDRKREFHRFVHLESYAAQVFYITSNITESKKKRSYVTLCSPLKRKPREFIRTYTLGNIPVCRDMFCRTLQITPQKVTVSLRKKRNDREIKDKRGETAGGWNKTPQRQIELIIDVIKRLPKYESHYRREKNSDALYLQPGMTVPKIYELFKIEFEKEFGKDEKCPSFNVVRHIFVQKFNLRCKSLKKDTCNKCVDLGVIEDLQELWPSGKLINKKKLNDLKSLFHLIPNDCIGYYKKLKGDDAIIDDIDGYCDEPDFDLDEEKLDEMAEEQQKETASQKYRRKLKENPELHADHLRRERARDSKRREIMKKKMEADEDLKILARIRSKERMQTTRKRRREEQIKQIGTRYNSPRTLGKAVAKVKRNLPVSPTKAVEVVKKIAAEFKITASDKSNAPKAVPRKLTDEGKKQICDFYNRDDVSRQMPGIKDVKQSSPVRERKRPAHILPINDTPHNVCVCTTHSNYINLLLAISKHSTDFPKTHQELLKQISCNVDNEDCMSNSCDVCKESNIWDITLDSNPIVNWKAWIFQNHRPKQIVMSKPFNLALDELHDSTAKFNDNCAAQFKNRLSKNIFFVFVAKEEVKEKMAMLDDKWEGLKNIPGIQSKHFFQSVDGDTISVARTSLSLFKYTLVLKSPTTTNNAESDWDDDDLGPLTNYRIQKEILCPDISVPSVSDQSKSFVPPKTRLRVSDVYSDSDNDCINDESRSTFDQTSKLPAEACPKTGTGHSSILPNAICAGLYVLVQLLCKAGKKMTQYRYVGLCQSDVDEDGEIRIQFLTTINGKRFTEIVNDIADVKFEDIIAKLEAPEKKTDGNNIIIEFSQNIDTCLFLFYDLERLGQFCCTRDSTLNLPTGYLISLDSPAAPAYSPLTPLATRKETEKNNSPIPPMSPSTLDGEETDSSCSSVKQKRRKSVEIPESDSSENETATEGLIQTHVAMVHDNQSKTDRTTQMRHDDENHFIVTNAVYDDITVVQPETEVAHPITENNDALQSKGRSKCGRKRKHPEYCISEKKGRKYMNLPYHVKDKLVKSKVFYDYTCTCKQRCHLLVPTETRKQEFDRFITLGSYEAQLRERNNGTQYLKLGMTIQKIYDIYLAEFKKVYGSEKKFVSFATLKHIFYTNLNLQEDFDVLWPQGKAIPQAKLEDLRSMYSLIPEDCHAFYDSLKGNSCISEYVDGYGPSLDFDLEEDKY
ncbi:hypothetical protein HW555_009995 [Spodoptera exigua]|uniref:Uncharacterized protein n=1 Tax=Spodoptera exigua TaxID=7107 RepID=A0A835GC04_SPOEX|nr:hypothetical protein HW555_009995 [Spodoptera exigua]